MTSRLWMGWLIGSLIAWLLGIPTLAASTPQLPQADLIIAKPLGVFAASGSQNAAVIGHEQVHGGLVRIPWNLLETSPGVYNWQQVDLVVAKIRAAGKYWSLAVLAGPATPNWLYETPYNAPRIRYLFQGNETTVAPAWHPAVRERLRLLALAMAEKYANDPSLMLVYVSQMTANGIEGQLPFERDLLPSGTTWAALGWSADGWVTTVTGITSDFAAAFPQKALAVELHYVLNDPQIPRRIGDSICGNSAFAGRVGIAIWWLSGRETYQPDLLDYFRQADCDKYGQVIGSSDQSDRFPAEGYAMMFAQARELGLRYIEPWEQEFTTLCCTWEAEFAAFNAWSVANFGATVFLPWVTENP
ncbi:MAG: beta-galactosidase [Chloroflexi bacterium]|nr:beta-galactosidase [Chloroflexota bacterium]